jgi:hypothetical protein
MLKMKNKIKEDQEVINITSSGDTSNAADTVKKVQDQNPDAQVNLNVVDESEDKTGGDYDIYAVCTKSTGGKSGDAKWEKCVKALKDKPGYTLGESIKPKMTKQELIETVLRDTRVITKIKVKDILK